MSTKDNFYLIGECAFNSDNINRVFKEDHIAKTYAKQQPDGRVVTEDPDPDCFMVIIDFGGKDLVKWLYESREERDSNFKNFVEVLGVQ